MSVLVLFAVPDSPTHTVAVTVAENGDDNIAQTPLLRFVADLLFSEIDFPMNHLLITS